MSTQKSGLPPAPLRGERYYALSGGIISRSVGPDHSADGVYVGQVSGDQPDAKAVALLFAAAPRLYKALKETLRAFEEHLSDEAKEKGVDVATLCPCSGEEVKRAYEALRAAEGLI